MGPQLQDILENKRCLRLMCVTFAVITMIPYFELPYGIVLSSLISSGKGKHFPTSDANVKAANNVLVGNNYDSDNDSAGSLFTLTPTSAPLPSTIQVKANSSISGSPILLTLNISSQNDIIAVNNILDDPVKEKHETPVPEVVSISQMNEIFISNHASSDTMRPLWSSTVDEELLKAKTHIENAPIGEKVEGIYSSLYQNISMFRRSYELMEQTLKVYVYKEGKKPIFHQPVLKGIYSSEGWFMRLLQGNKQFVTKIPNKAHLFYIPFSSKLLEDTVVYFQNCGDEISRLGTPKDVIFKAPQETEEYMGNCIRALCNADVKEGFKLGKDVSLPETAVRSVKNPLKGLGGKPPSERSVLAFFAGQMHGYVRPILLQHWQNKDSDMKIFGKLRSRYYVDYMKNSKYCICPKGYEVNSPRVVEAIFYDCVPVIISDNFVPPFFEVLNWESFAVFVQEKDIPNLKKILLSISERQYLLMQQRVKLVQQHFLWNLKPVKYDIFHMILHSIWYNRLFQTESK